MQWGREGVAVVYVHLRPNLEVTLLILEAGLKTPVLLTKHGGRK